MNQHVPAKENRMSKGLSAAAVRQFNDHGYLFPVPVLSGQWLYRKCLAGLRRMRPADQGQRRNKSTYS